MYDVISVHFSRSVMSDSLWPHGLQNARPPCPSPTPRVYSNSCPLSRWWHPTISSSVVPFSSLPSIFPASGSFPMSQFFASGGQSIGALATASVPPVNIQDCFPLGNSFHSYCFSHFGAQSLGCVQLFATLWTTACQASLSFAIFWRLFKLMSIESVMPSNCLILCRFLLLPSVFPSIRVFSNESALCHRWPKYWSFSFSISPSIEYSGSISFRMG